MKLSISISISKFRLSFITALILLSFTASQEARSQNQTLSVSGGLVSLSGGQSTSFTFQPSLGFQVGQRLSDNWFMHLGFSKQTFYMTLPQLPASLLAITKITLP